jgi:hydroxylysine kinase
MTWNCQEDIFKGSVLVEPAPALSSKQALHLLEQHWGLRDPVLTPVGSERDQNLRIDSDAGRFLLKIANCTETPAITRLQTAVLRHVATQDPSIPLPRVVPTCSGETEVYSSGSAVRLLTWIEGIPLYLTPHSHGQRVSVATGHARLVLALRAYISDITPPAIQWDIQHTGRLWDALASVPGELIERVHAALELFDRHASGRLRTLARQFVHNDIQPYNLVVAEACTDRLCGILDFGDMVCAPVACDLAVACAYQVLPSDHPLQTVGEYVAAFHSVRAVSEEELNSLPALIAARHATTIVITSLRAAAHPENARYILRNRPIAESGLSQLLSVPYTEAVDYLRSVCQ